MEASELAGKMLEWERKRRELDALEDEIIGAVLAVGKTQTVGNVRASYSGGRKTYNYEEAAHDHPMVGEATIALFTSTVVKIDWRGICKHAGIDDVPFIKSDPSVSLKLLD